MWFVSRPLDVARPTSSRRASDLKQPPPISGFTTSWQSGLDREKAFPEPLLERDLPHQAGTQAHGTSRGVVSGATHRPAGLGEQGRVKGAPGLGTWREVRGPRRARVSGQAVMPTECPTRGTWPQSGLRFSRVPPCVPYLRGCRAPKAST